MNNLAAQSRVKLSLHASSFPKDYSVERIIAEAAGAGLDAIELNFSPAGTLSPATTQSDCAALQSLAKSNNLSISALCLVDVNDAQLGSPRLESRQAAAQYIRDAIERAVWLGTDLVNIQPAMIPPPSTVAPAASYEETFTFATQGLAALRFEAMQHAVRLACRAGGNRFLLSPMEMRSFIDNINSPWIGVCLDVAAVMACVHPRDWIQSLGHRLLCVHTGGVDYKKNRDESAPLDESHMSLPALLLTLNTIRYTGFITCLNPVELAPLKTLMAQIADSSNSHE